jgi:hypothetical protein
MDAFEMKVGSKDVCTAVAVVQPQFCVMGRLQESI